jgi:cytosine/adenosine deaminase-related metal-dependent hydrolase
MATLLIKAGRVVDPASGRDEVTDVVVDGDRVTAVGTGLTADDEIDATGMIVGPGFVDLHSHAHGIAGQRLQALDGVTTALDLEAGLMPLAAGYRQAAAEGRPLHYGFSASWAMARGRVLAGVHPEPDILGSLAVLGDERWQKSSTKDQLDAWIGMLADEIADGALGVGILVGYAPQSDPEEYLAVARLAGTAGVPTWTHVRELVEADPTTPIDGSSEVVRAAAETGGHMHHCHVNSTSRRHIDRVLTTLADARAAGSRVTVEAYPYGAGATGVGAAFLAPERLGAWGLEPSNLVLLPSGERIADAGRLRQVREADPGMPCIVEFLSEDDPVDRDLMIGSLDFADCIVASDAMPVIWPDGRHDSAEWPLPPGGTTHPRTAGTFCKSLRIMVRETGRWTWLEAFRRGSWLPARTLDFAPGARSKGRLGPGADADIVVIDPTVVTDQATYLDPTRPSVGVRHLLVAGQAVVRDGEIVADAFPGRPLRAEPG